MVISLDDLRRFAVANILFPPAILKHALDKLVSSRPIRSAHRLALRI
jgi:hypothetical protein